ncbi:hypothetical protein FOZ63_000088 [Perkinsus olseni]|uniref:Uncharacterized protein n=1 Tax=Perkinsus olseni TaxID=32597 RepID=A0A7J6T306_PEROL|nr:hypothetical protein FOZ63_000088 [Perkinsus olseni]
MVIILTLLFPLLVATVSAFQFNYRYEFDKYRISFGFDPTASNEITTECWASEDQRKSGSRPITTFNQKFPIIGEGCPHYYTLTFGAKKSFENYRKILEEDCGLSLNPEAFQDMYLFSGFFVINLDHESQIILKPIK